jgi:hypothetical protein
VNLFMIVYNKSGVCSCVTYFARTFRGAKNLFLSEFQNESVSFRKIELLSYGG